MANNFIKQLALDIPIFQAPMAAANGVDMALAVSQAGALGAMPCAMLSAEQIVQQVDEFRRVSDKAFNLNFFCHQEGDNDPALQQRWLKKLEGFYEAEGLDLPEQIEAPSRAPFNSEYCQVVEKLRPAVVSFHFGLPEPGLLDRVKASGCLVVSSATTVQEALWLRDRGCDAVIAQGLEAGGHRGIFLAGDPVAAVSQQPGLMALLPQITDAIDIPVIAAGGIADGRAVAAARTLGASFVQIGTALLFSKQATVTPLHRAALNKATADDTALSNVFSGRPARGIMNRIMREIGPLSDSAAPFPTAGGALGPLKSAAEKDGRADYSSLWAGQGVATAAANAAALRDRSGEIAADNKELDVADIIRALHQDAVAKPIEN